MKTLRKLVLAAAAAAACAYSALAAPVATGTAYELDSGKGGTEDNACQSLLPSESNLLYGLTPAFVEGDHSWYNGGSYYETQSTSTNVISDGKIPLHTNEGGSFDYLSGHRLLVPGGSTMTWTWTNPEVLKNVKLYTQWPDGARNDIMVTAIAVRSGADTWTTLANSSFKFSRYSDQNTIQPYLDGGTKNRMVTFADENKYANLATDVTGLRITFGNQSGDICYGCYWEIEAERGTAGNVLDFSVKNTVNGGTDYVGKGEVEVDVMPYAPAYSKLGG